MIPLTGAAPILRAQLTLSKIKRLMPSAIKFLRLTIQPRHHRKARLQVNLRRKIFPQAKRKTTPPPLQRANRQATRRLNKPSLTRKMLRCGLNISMSICSHALTAAEAREFFCALLMSLPLLPPCFVALPTLPFLSTAARKAIDKL